MAAKNGISKMSVFYWTTLYMRYVINMPST